MTGLGAAIYGGFFALAALWLFLTSDYAGFRKERGQDVDRYDVDAYDQAPHLSNSTRTDVDAEVSNDWLVSHSSSK